jgi:hypothetical protein
MNGRRSLLRTVGAASVFGVPTAGCLDRDAAVPTVLGTYPGPNPADETTYRPFERWLDRRHAALTLYFDAQVPQRRGDVLVAHRLTSVWNSGHVPLLTWEPFLGGRDETPETMAGRIAAGEYDETVDRWVALLAAWLDADASRRLYFRPMHEMNGDWYPWGATDADATPDDYVAAWRHLHEAMAAGGVDDDRLLWMWSPNADDAGGDPAEAFYPGDDYVDWLGVDGYNFGDSREWSDWRWPDDVFGDMIGRLRGLTDRPLAVPEFGTSTVRGGGHDLQAKSRWIRRAFDTFRSRDVAMACWFNVDKETDWAVFGGERGATTYDDGGTIYRAYPEYREVAARDDVVTGEADASPRHSWDTFAGRF